MASSKDNGSYDQSVSVNKGLMFLAFFSSILLTGHLL